LSLPELLITFCRRIKLTDQRSLNGVQKSLIVASGCVH